jgi:hypothetical protein
MTASYGIRQLGVLAPVEVLTFPKPPPVELLQGFQELRVRWSDAHGSTSRFVVALLESSIEVQQLGPVVFDFVVDRSAWVRLLEFHGASGSTRERLLADLNFKAVSQEWSTPLEEGWRGFIKAWVEACRGLPTDAATRNLLKAYRARFPRRRGRS